MVEIKNMQHCTVEEKVQAWNTGFEGYYFDMTTTPDAFEKRGEAEGLSDKLSVVAFEDGTPVGLVRNGVREWQGKKVAWNGGTGVAPSVRGKGIGKKLMEAALDILQSEGVHAATLEAVKENKQAIEFYKRMGYSIVDEVHFMQLKGKVKNIQFSSAGDKISLSAATPEDAGQLSFYRGDFTWQTQWESVKDGEAVFAADKTGKAIGYAYFRKTMDHEGKHASTVLYQCEVAPDSEGRKAIAEQLILAVFDQFSGNINRIAVNVPVEGNKLTHEALEEFGFIITAAQVFMKKEL
ncbi:GNAT family N-acetyltransferase [Planomicrobium sp. CPCC 101079]|uniref:GNAT family N-acetyltransferase n=1 Tax=Planomicrobium sp. CPCC 101079 TaxID=2599618 RepID=UPI001644F974|nr:GNAT family N-acetyltransferase [Planomicrobium sp. CPCC 101079]